ncbi:hypothetical protein COU60_01040 [Candidatus Pacearchaeota archaeon CG10_big_fil_rev_8_21_14_0_10_34_76]|nr:MAG: hypothetical protein COU60_01040 [Candidatus Pacearchaeota archaeon CG10_big_fil_rev_8_21_14_0_10_34_76]
MNRLILMTIALSLFIFSANLATSAECDMKVSLINQDPYPAVPGDYVKLVFQVTGIENPQCINVNFELVEKYPLQLDPNTASKIQVKGGTYTSQDFTSSLLVPYKVRLDASALDGDAQIETRVGTSNLNISNRIYNFNISVKDVRSDFEVFVKNYNPSTRKITFEILNTGKSDVEALTLEINSQENFNLRGPGANIIGSLDSKDFTTADFEAIVKEGDIEMTIYYIDEVKVRRSLPKSIYFNPQPFIDREKEQQSTPVITYIVGLLILVIVIYFFYRKYKNKKRKKI